MDEQAERNTLERTAQMVGTPGRRTLCFAEWGEPRGAPVFSLHGTPGCRLLNSRRVDMGFEDLLCAVGVRLITYDRPGYGRADRHRGRRVADSAADVETIADAVGIEEFAIEGGSSGSMHALAAAALLGGRVTRAACVAPMAPYDQLGREEWSRGQDDAVVEYIGWCLEGEDRLAAEVAREDAELREEAAGDESIVEQTRNGIWGWVDDELAAFEPWGFEPAGVAVPTAIYFDPNETVLPRQHGEWLARTLPRATVVTTAALGHGSEGDPKPDWRRLYSWLIESRN
jgi:pimeloyl-ACP methyl ester carboxylesterase